MKKNDGASHNHHPYSNLISKKGMQKYTLKKKNSIFDKWCWSNQNVLCARVNLDSYLTLHKAELYMDERPQHKTWCPESNRGESKVYI